MICLLYSEDAGDKNLACVPLGLLTDKDRYRLPPCRSACQRLPPQPVHGMALHPAITRLMLSSAIDCSVSSGVSSQHVPFHHPAHTELISEEPTVVDTSFFFSFKKCNLSVCFLEMNTLCCS